MKRRPHRVKHACLKQVREIAKITQSELAKMIGVSDAAIIAIEAGYLPMSVKMARRIMSHSGVTLAVSIGPDRPSLRFGFTALHS